MPDLERGNIELEVAHLHNSEKTSTNGPSTRTSDHGDGLAISGSTKAERSYMKSSPKYSYEDVFEKLSNLHDHYRTDIFSETETLDTMHLRNLWYLRSRISKHMLISNAAQEGIFDGKFEHMINTEEIRRDLKHYTAALRDWQYWKENKRFMTASLTRMRALTTHLATIDFAKHVEQIGHFDEDNFLHQAQQKLREHIKLDFFSDEVRERHNSVFMAAAIKQRSDFQRRLLIAVSAGLALIAPMLIMSLHQSKLTSLLTTSIFVVFVAILLAWVMEDAQNKDIVAATAAYAAVLVVFVGTGSGA